MWKPAVWSVGRRGQCDEIRFGVALGVRFSRPTLAARRRLSRGRILTPRPWSRSWLRDEMQHECIGGEHGRCRAGLLCGVLRIESTDLRAHASHRSVNSALSLVARDHQSNYGGHSCWNSENYDEERRQAHGVLLCSDRAVWDSVDQQPTIVNSRLLMAGGPLTASRGKTRGFPSPLRSAQAIEGGRPLLGRCTSSLDGSSPAPPEVACLVAPRALGK